MYNKGNKVVLAVEGLSKRYGDVVAVDGISFTITAGQCFGLLGPNGAGKTTTIEMMEGLIAPSAGHIHYAIGCNGREIRHQIGIQFQHTALQDFLTVKETLTLFAAFYQQTLPIDELVTLCDLGDYLGRDNRLLSGGQRQRLLLALALINDPDIIFLDEPTTGLDPQARRHFWQLIQHIKARGKTIILTTHYMDEAEQLCDEIVVMEKGQIIEQGKPFQLLKKHFDNTFILLPALQVPDIVRSRYQHQLRDDVIEINTQDVEQTLTDLISDKVSLQGLHVESANLDDLFLKLTGHSLRD